MECLKKLKLCYKFIAFFILCFTSTFAHATGQAIMLDVTGAIGPATQDYIERNLELARTDHAAVMIIRLDTPGGLETSMRGISKAILASPIPVVTWVAPSGARAASAGTFILYASHVAAMAPGTNVGAASPVNMGSQKMPSTMQKKAMNDAAALIRSLAELRGRNVEWPEKAVREAVSLSADEALKMKVIDLIADNVPELLKKTNGRMVKIQNEIQTIKTENIQVQMIKPDWRFQFLSVLTNPDIAYILLLVGIYGLFFEFYNPGFVLPGVAGVISLLLALYAFQLLPVNYTGFALLLLGITFMTIEIFVSGFGVLAIGGIISFVVGSIFLLDTHVAGFSIAWQLILLMALVSAVFFFVVINLAVRSMNKKIVTGREALMGSMGEVLDHINNQWQVRIQGEIWEAHCDVPLQRGQKVRVKQVLGLLLKVEPLNDINQKD